MSRHARIAVIALISAMMALARDAGARREPWSERVELRGHSTFTPALAVRDGRQALVGWTEHRDSKLHFVLLSLGAPWFEVSTDEVATSGPALAWAGGEAVVAFAAEDTRLTVLRSANGSSWGERLTIEKTTASSPALCVFGKTLILAWRGEGDRIHLLHSGDGKKWEDEVALEATALSGPALTVAGERLIVAFRGAGDRLNVVETTDGAHFTAPVVLPNRTTTEPAVAVWHEGLTVAWTDAGDGRIHMMTNAGGSEWSGESVTNIFARRGPAMVTWNEPVMAFNDADNYGLTTIAWENPFSGKAAMKEERR